MASATAESLQGGGAVSFSGCSRNFDCLYHETLQKVRSKGRGERDVGRVPPARHDEVADPADVMTDVKDVPLSSEVDFHPRAEIHRIWIRWHPDIAEISGRVPCWNIKAP